MNKCANKSSTQFEYKWYLTGGLLIAFGLLLLSLNLNWFNPGIKSIIFSWPMFFMLLAVVSLFKKEGFQFLSWFVLGTFFLLPRIAKVFPEHLPGIDGNFTHDYWPLILVLFGMGIMLRRLFCKHKRPSVQNKESVRFEEVSGRLNRSVVFGGSENIVLDPVFSGGSISAVFGGVVIDLRNSALPEGDTLLDIEAIFGGVTLHIPDHWSIDPRFETVMGGFTDKRLSKATKVDHSRKLILQGSLIFGGCEIK